MINIRMQHKEVQKLTPKITVVGVGGAGGNAVNNMISSGLQGVEFIVCNTDAQALEGSLCENKIQLGVTVTGGLGAGARPDVGCSAAEESLDEVMQHLDGANMAFITAGMGGGTGTGAAPVIARACREKGILTVGVVTKPFHFEGSTRMRMADQGIEEMQDYVDTLIVIPNQNLFRIANEKTTFAEAFKMADGVLQSGVRGVTDLMVMPGLINLDFSDIRSAMLEMGKAMMGTGEATGDRRAIESAEKAINNPLLDDVSMKGARGVIINVTGGYDMTLFEVDEACNRIRDEVDPSANIIFGSTFEEGMDSVMRVSVVATGIDVAEEKGRKGTSGLSLNTITQQQQPERKVERTQPNTVNATATMAQQQPQTQPQVQQEQAVAMPTAPKQAITGGYTYAPLNLRPAVPVPPATAAAAVAVAQQKQDEPDKDICEQQELVGSSTTVQQQVQQQQVPPLSSAPVTAQPQPNSALRGNVYNDAFIPPRAVEADQVRTDTAGYASLSAGRRPASAEQPVQTGAGLTLRPPVPGASTTAQQQQKKRTPSLFERFTGPLWNHDSNRTEEDTSSGKGEGGSSSSGGNAGSSFHGQKRQQAQQQPIQQGSLNIGAPKTENVDDELDIPAFLRRQAN